MMPDDPNVAEDRGDDPGLAPESGPADALLTQDAAGAALQAALSDTTDGGDESLSEEEILGLSPQLGERGIDLGTLMGAMLAAGSQTKPKPKPVAGHAASAGKEDPAALLGKLAESLGLSPADLLKHLGPAFKALMNGQGSPGGAKPRRKPKPKPAGKPRLKPASKPKPATKPKPKPKPKAASKPKPATKPKPAAKPKK